MHERIREEPGAGAELEVRLLGDLRALLPQGDNRGITYTMRDPAGRLVAGATGGISYGWLLIKILWVEAAHRRQGLGARLLDAMEEKARTLGCHAAWLDSSNPAAVAFYERRGYAAFGELANGPGRSPETHRRVFLAKTL